MNIGQGKKHIFDALSATGATASVVAHYGGKYPTAHTLEAIMTGTPDAATARLEGSLNGDTWFDLSGTQDLVALLAANGSATFHVANRAVQKVRANLLSLTGGTAPTVTFRYLGQPQ